MKMFVIQQLQFKEFYSLVKLFEYVHGANSSVGRVLWPVFEGNVVRLFSELFCLFRSHGFRCRSLLLCTNVPNDSNVMV